MEKFFNIENFFNFETYLVERLTMTNVAQKLLMSLKLVFFARVLKVRELKKLWIRLIVIFEKFNYLIVPKPVLKVMYLIMKSFLKS